MQPPQQQPQQPSGIDPRWGVPEEAGVRLAKNRAGTSGAVFSSNLSVPDFLLLRDAGFRPVGMVYGVSMYHLGIQYGNWTQNQELPVLSQSLYNARELAMGRMLAEAHALGADGVVGVSIRVNRYAWGEYVEEFEAIGTAVVADRPPGSGTWRDLQGRPFVSDLSHQDFWTLTRAGYAPVSFVLGVCVYHLAHQKLGQLFRNAGQNAEIPQFTEAMYTARELAMARMHAEAAQCGAEGVVGFDLVLDSHVFGHHATEFLASGTGIRQVGDTQLPLVAPVSLAQVSSTFQNLPQVGRP